MIEFFQWFMNLIKDLIGLLARPVFEWNGYGISVLSFAVAMIALGLVTSVFWRGAKT